MQEFPPPLFSISLQLHYILGKVNLACRHRSRHNSRLQAKSWGIMWVSSLYFNRLRPSFLSWPLWGVWNWSIWDCTRSFFCGFVLVALQCFETQSCTHQCRKNTMREYSPSLKATNHPSERKTLMAATGGTMECRAGTDLGKKAWLWVCRSHTAVSSVG